MQKSLPLMGCINNEMREMPYEEIAQLSTEQRLAELDAERAQLLGQTG